MMKNLKVFKVYHWDTFDNETILISEHDTFEEADEFVNKRFGLRISNNGADQVDIVNLQGDIVKKVKIT